MKFARISRLTAGAVASALAALLLMPPAAGAELAVKDDTGRVVHLAAPARRIVALAPHVAETLFAIGAGNRLVGTVEYSDYPPAAKQVPRVGGYSRIDLEAVAALHPDLVIAWQSGNNLAQVDRLKALGITVYVSQPDHLTDIPVQIEHFGRLTGTEATAGPVAERFSQRLQVLRAANAGKPKVKVFYQIWKSPMMTIGGPQIISDAIRLCGGINIFGQLDQMAPTVSVESVLAADPEVIVATGMGEARPQWLSDWDRWTRLTAVRRGNLFHINPDLMQRHTPRIIEGVARLCDDLDLARARRPGR